MGRWPSVVALAIVVGGLVATFGLGALRGESVAQLWGYVIALVVALFARRVGGGGKPPSPLWPVGVLAAGDALPMLTELLAHGP